MSLLNLAGGLTLAAIAQASVAAPPSAHDLHAVQCVAALELFTKSLAAEVKSGKEDVSGCRRLLTSHCVLD